MAIHDDIDTPLARACRALGGQSALSRLIGKHQTTVHDRLSEGKPLWAEDVLTVEAATGISRHELRPDIYPIEESPASSAHAAQAKVRGEGASADPCPADARLDPSDADPLQGLQA